MLFTANRMSAMHNKDMYQVGSIVHQLLNLPFVTSAFLGSLSLGDVGLRLLSSL